MSAHRYFQLDVFSHRPGGGNPLGVVVGADDWSDEAMQAFARWTDLVETTFLLTPTTPQASYRVRIFTPQREIAFAGHPSIGSAHAVLEAGIAMPRDGRLVQECQAGLLPVRVEGDGDARRLSVQSPRSRVLTCGIDAQPLLAGILDGVDLGALPPAFVEGGRRWWLAEFASESALRAWQPDHAAIGALAQASGSLGLCAFARCEGDEFDLCVRAFPAGVGIVEDPASGAANGLIGAWIAEAEPHGTLARGYTVSQGREIGHDARIVVRIDADGAVWVGGCTRTMVEGVTRWLL
ncbi:PhzF family phenazine biosynthesis protein [Dokdonella sp.]|uniref:PhzF family phenazine biosynthesis protein n=1 Tax=Dokdonella sp. TaxID=2291710 RepID=UPI0025B8A9F9|nr:PhzF family phenazine biosynthesis protein [Dokdonella sp.]MBX3693073.1 PhzF family phenazine biosynthesis protein [Dokdonella sp.]MCW5567350.1 PhzF family phenazine biosynthesis protein [Dokdonella sp.]